MNSLKETDVLISRNAAFRKLLIILTCITVTNLGIFFLSFFGLSLNDSGLKLLLSLASFIVDIAVCIYAVLCHLINKRFNISCRPSIFIYIRFILGIFTGLNIVANFTGFSIQAQFILLIILLVLLFITLLMATISQNTLFNSIKNNHFNQDNSIEV